MCYSLSMKNAFKNKRVWIFGSIMSVVGIGLPFLILVITLNIDDATPFQYPLLHGLFAAIYLLIGFIWGDMHTVLYRRKVWDDIGEYDDQLFCVEDYDYWIRILKNGKYIDHISDQVSPVLSFHNRTALVRAGRYAP